MVVPRWNRVFSRVHAAQGVPNMAVPSWNHVPHRRVSNMVVPSWSHVLLRAQATQRGYLTWWPLAGTAYFYVSRPPRRYLTWRSRAGTTCFHVSRPDRGVSNMVVPSWNHVFLRVQATQRGVSNMVVLTWNHVFLRVQATQRGYLT